MTFEQINHAADVAQIVFAFSAIVFSLGYYLFKRLRS